MPMPTPARVSAPPALAAGYWFVVGGDYQLWLGAQERIVFGEQSALPAPWDKAAFVRFDVWHGKPCYLLDVGSELPNGPHFVPLRQLLSLHQSQLFALAARAWQLTTFRRTHQFCGECGAAMAPQRLPSGATEWAQVCAQGHIAYPRISPCIIVAVRKSTAQGEPAILLALHQRHAQHTPAMHTVLAGFVEAGETLEQCVAREVAEECGVKVRQLRYVASQSWPFPHSLMMGFIAEYAGGQIVPQASEIASARFYTRAHLPHLPAHGTLARQLIELALAPAAES
ncbi:MAG: NAD(+) diphosphatase [Aeromonas sp.]